MQWWEKTPAVLSGDYENIYALTDEITHSEVRFLLNETSIQPPSSVLDLGCGTGRHSMRFAELGYTVTGLDLSPDFLKIANQKSLESGLSVEWINRDMRDIPFANKFDLTFIMFGAWGYFEEDRENYIVLKEIHKALKMNGHFILDYLNHDWIVRNFQPRHWVKREIGYYLEKRSLDIQNGRLNTESIVIKRDGSILEWETSTRAYTLKEIKNMLQQAGFNIIHIYGNLERQSFDLNSPRLLIHAQKKS